MSSAAGLGDARSQSRPLPVEPARRGRLVMSRNVVEKVASQAALEVVATAGRSRGLLGFGGKTDSGARPKVDADLSSASTDLAISIGVTYPTPIRSTTQQIREHVTHRVEELTGVDVRRVDIDVTFLNVEAGSTRVPGVLR